MCYHEMGKGVLHMDSLEIATQLTLQAMEKGFISYDVSDDTEARAKQVAIAFKTILQGVDDAMVNP